MATERQLTVDQACAEITKLRIDRRITEVIIHHTWEPSAAGYRGIATVRGVRRYHQEKWPIYNDNGYHIMVGPNGEIFFCRAFNKKGAHSRGHNSRSIGLAYIADFGGPPHIRPPLDNPATYRGLAAGQVIVAALCERFNLGVEDVYFHSNFSSKTCPGLLMDRSKYRQAVGRFMDGGLRVVLLPGSQIIPCRPRLEEGITRVDLRSLATALDCEVYDHLVDQGKVYLRPKPKRE